MSRLIRRSFSLLYMIGTFSCVLAHAEPAAPTNANRFSKFGLPSKTTAYVLPSGAIQNPDLPLKESHSVALAWMCAALRDFPAADRSEAYNELRIVRQPRDGSYVLQVPFDLGVNTRQMWLLANEFVRTDIKEIKNGFFFENASPAESIRQKKVSELAQILIAELRKRDVKVAEIKKLNAAAEPSSTVIAHVTLPSLITSFRAVLAADPVPTDFIAQTLAPAFSLRKLSPPTTPLTFHYLNDCVGHVLLNFQTAPEFLTLIPASTNAKGEAERRMSTTDDSGNYFILKVLRVNELQKYAILSSAQKPTDQKTFEDEFP